MIHSIKKTLKPLLIFRSILPHEQPERSQQAPVSLQRDGVTCYSTAGCSISVNYMFSKQLCESSDHLLNKSSRSGCGYVLSGVFNNSINPRILGVTKL